MNSRNREESGRRISLLLLFFLIAGTAGLTGCGKRSTQTEQTEAHTEMNTQKAPETEVQTSIEKARETQAQTDTEKARETQAQADTEKTQETQAQTDAETVQKAEIMTEGGPETADHQVLIYEGGQLTAAETETDEPQETDSADMSAVLSREEFLACPAGTILNEEQIDREHPERYFISSMIDPQGEVFARMYGKSFKEDCTVPLEDLRYIKLLHYGFDGMIHVGELVVSSYIETDIAEIFRILFDNRYEIEKMYLIDRYDADDTASIEDNNTSAFNFRLVTNGTKLSNHAYGYAIDINPQQNPYVTFDENGEAYWVHENASSYIDRSDPFPEQMHMITEEDLCFRLFTERGFTWGGSWNNPKDYQHFEKKPAQ